MQAPAGNGKQTSHNLEKLNEAAASALPAPDLNEWLESQRALVIRNSPDRLRAGVHREAAQWAEQFRNINIELQ